MQRAKLFFELKLYGRVLLLSILLSAVVCGYLVWQGSPNLLNRTVANVSMILISLSLMMSGMGYFFSFLDKQVIYRKHLGLVGFGFGMWHFLLSFTGLAQLQRPAMWTGFVALLILTLMALISNHLATKLMGGVWWRRTLRLGFVALFLIVVHVWLLRAHRWWAWLTEGLSGSTVLALGVTVLAVLVLLLRVVLEIAFGASNKHLTDESERDTGFISPASAADAVNVVLVAFWHDYYQAEGTTSTHRKRIIEEHFRNCFGKKHS